MVISNYEPWTNELITHWSSGKWESLLLFSAGKHTCIAIMNHSNITLTPFGKENIFEYFDKNNKLLFNRRLMTRGFGFQSCQQKNYKLFTFFYILWSFKVKIKNKKINRSHRQQLALCLPIMYLKMYFIFIQLLIWPKLVSTQAAQAHGAFSAYISVTCSVNITHHIGC